MLTDRGMNWTFGLGALLALVLLLVSIIPAGAQDDEFGTYEPGKHVYDRAGILTSSETDRIEQAASEIQEAGAPTVVYLQEKEADYEETVADARDLMESWDIQSSDGARDGVVIFMNLEPDNPRHGQLALVAGETHFDGGNLPQYQMDRITSEMRSLLSDEQTAAGILRGLEMIESSLTTGPPPPPEPSQAEQIAGDLSRNPWSPVNIIALLLSAALGVFTYNKWQSQPGSNAPVTPTTSQPDELVPAAAGALVEGRINDLQMEATLLDLARRGAISVEPAGKKKVQVNLLDSEIPRTDLEVQIWNAMEEEAGEDRVVSHKELSKVRSHWKPAKAVLRDGLEARDWFDPEHSRRRLPLYLAGTGSIVLAAVAFIISIVGQQPWGLGGAGLLFVAGLAALIIGNSIRSTTALGESVAAPWRGYKRGLEQAIRAKNRELDLDQIIPHAIAMGISRSAINKRLERASDDGYNPLWLGAGQDSRAWGNEGFFVYWIAFHGSISPTAGAGGGAGGAAAGSGASGGGF